MRAAYGAIEVLKGVDSPRPPGSVAACSARTAAARRRRGIAGGLMPSTSSWRSRAQRHRHHGHRGRPARHLLDPGGPGVFANLTVRENLWSPRAPVASAPRSRTRVPRFPARRAGATSSPAPCPRGSDALRVAGARHRPRRAAARRALHGPRADDRLADVRHRRPARRRGISILVASSRPRRPSPTAAPDAGGRASRVGRPAEIRTNSPPLPEADTLTEERRAEFHREVADHKLKADGSKSDGPVRVIGILLMIGGAISAFAAYNASARSRHPRHPLQPDPGGRGSWA